MSWRLQRRINFAPRFTLSKRGLGTSVGLRGLRISRSAGGRPYAGRRWPFAARLTPAEGRSNRWSNILAELAASSAPRNEFARVRQGVRITSTPSLGEDPDEEQQLEPVSQTASTTNTLTASS